MPFVKMRFACAMKSADNHKRKNRYHTTNKYL